MACLILGVLSASSFIGIFVTLLQIRLAYNNSDISNVTNKTFLPSLAILLAILPRKIDLPMLVSPANTYRALPASKNPPPKLLSNHSHVLGTYLSTELRSSISLSTSLYNSSPRSVTRLMLHDFSNLSKTTDVSTSPLDTSSATLSIV